MDKHVIIINGRGGVGKDSLCACAAEFYRSRSISSIHPILEIARCGGWDGRKNRKSRRLLAQLKEVFTEFNDLSFAYCMREYHAFLESSDLLLFVHIREPIEIDRFRRAVGTGCHTLLVRRRAVEAQGALGNAADDSVLQYPYDYRFDNDGPIENLPESVHAFLEIILTSEYEDDTLTWYFR